MTLRKSIFWLHLIAGLIAGLVIAIMCFTGTALAFEKEIVAYAERDARRITAPAPDAPRLSLADLFAHVRAAYPTAQPGGIILQNHPHAAVAFTADRQSTYYANPYTGEIREPASTRTRDTLKLLVDWHRVLALGGEQRPVGKAITGACNLAFFVLAVTGLYLWWPRKWRTKGLRRSLWFIRRPADAKARNWNWHNVIGLWTAPVLIVLTLTALPISYRWAGQLLFTITGTPPPPPAPANTAPAAKLTPPSSDAKPLSAEALITVAQKQFPTWKTLTYRAGTTQPATIAIRTADSWPRTANTTLSLHPFTGEILKRTGYAELNAAQQLRSWTRYLHTGEALGWPGQLVAGLASLGGCVLVYTGFALGWHRWRRWRSPPSAPG
jgi:uncharacterized iron-regulated membrane protein